MIHPIVRRTTAWLLYAVTVVSPAFADEGLSVGDRAPDEIGTDADGDGITFADLRGKVVIVTFWASWCAPCRAELPILENLQRAAGDERLRVVAVNFKEDRKLYRRMLRDFRGAAIAMVHDERGWLSGEYGVRSLPHMFIFDHTGTIRHVHKGYSPEMLDGFVDEINALLAERAQALARN